MKRLSLFIFIGIMLIFNTSCGKQKDKNPPKAAPKEGAVQEKAKDYGKYISKDIIKLVKECISKDQDLDYLKKYATGRELTKKEITKLNIQGEEKEYLNNILNDEIISMRSKIWLVDYDNDGVEELAVYEDSGGTGGFVYFKALEKDKSGVYKFANPIEYEDGENFGVLTANEFVKVKGKTYFLTENYNYNTHIFEGIGINAFYNGKYVEVGFVGRYGNKLEAKTQFIIDKKYEKLLEKLKIETPPIIANIDFGEAYSGSIEKPVPKNLEPNYQARLDKDWPHWNMVDIDNNGLLDFISKNLFLPSSMYSTSYLEHIAFLNLKGKLYKIDILQHYKTGLSEYNVQQLWFEKFAGKNYMVVLTQQDNSDKYYLLLYSLNKNKGQKLAKIQFAYKKEVNMSIRKPE